jgi:poly(3-hydroxyalkanoate) depolymerase
VELRTIAVDGLDLRVATSAGNPGTLPLFFFNGIGANLELLRGFVDEMGKHGIGIIAFDVPGTGGSSEPAAPYRLSWLANLASDLLAGLGVQGQVDVGGVSWGGAIAQEFTHRYPLRVRHLLLAATSAGAVSVPGNPSALAKLLDRRRYAERDFMAHIGGELYGGKFRGNPKLLAHYAASLSAPKGKGYFFQLLALVGWTSAHWLRTLRQPTLVLSGTDDPIVPLPNGWLLAKLIPNARLVTVEDGHLFLVTSARECAPIIAKFLLGEESLPGRAGQGSRAMLIRHAPKVLAKTASRLVQDVRKMTRGLRALSRRVASAVKRG